MHMQRLPKPNLATVHSAVCNSQPTLLPGRLTHITVNHLLVYHEQNRGRVVKTTKLSLAVKCTLEPLYSGHLKAVLRI